MNTLAGVTFPLAQGRMEGSGIKTQVTPSRMKSRSVVFLSLFLAIVTVKRAMAADGVAPGRVIVKFTDSLSASAADLLAAGQPFASALTDSSHSLDQLNQALQVSAAQEVFFSQHGMSTSAARAAFQAQLDAAKVGFPRRTARIPLDTPPPPDLTNIYRLSIPADQDPFITCAWYQSDRHVVWCQPDYVITADFVPNDPYYSSSGSWGQPYADLWGCSDERGRPSRYVGDAR